MGSRRLRRSSRSTRVVRTRSTPGGQTGGRPRLVVGAIAHRSGAGDGLPRRWLGGQAERREEAPHGVGSPAPRTRMRPARFHKGGPFTCKATQARFESSVTCQCQTPPKLHHTPANIHHAAMQKIRGLSSPECVGVRSRNHLLISRLKVRFLHGSPSNWGAATPPDSFLASGCTPFRH